MDRRNNPLHRYPFLSTRDVNEFLAGVAPLYEVCGVSIAGAREKFLGQIHRRTFAGISIGHLSYGTDFKASIQQKNFFLQGFPLTGCGQAIWNRSRFAVSRRGPGLVSGPDAQGELHYGADFSHIVLTIDADALTKRLSSLLDRPVNDPIRMAGDMTELGDRAIRRLVGFILAELNDHPGELAQPVLSDMEQAVLTAYLTVHRNNYSDRLLQRPAEGAHHQALKVAEYLQEHWDQPVTIAQMVAASGLSERSLFYTFAKAFETSPARYLAQLRLQKARDMLIKANGPAHSPVTDTALACGFANLGDFSRRYRQAFGELPSQTVASRRRQMTR